MNFFAQNKYKFGKLLVFFWYQKLPLHKSLANVLINVCCLLLGVSQQDA